MQRPNEIFKIIEYQAQSRTSLEVLGLVSIFHFFERDPTFLGIEINISLKKKCFDLPSLFRKYIVGIFHCYQVNDCSSKILLIKGGTYFLRHCHPSIDKISFINKRRNVLVFSMKNTVLLLLIKIFYIIKGGTYWFSV